MSTVYVGNLSYDATAIDLKYEFDRYGKIKDIWVAKQPPGFAFIEFEDKQDAEIAVKGSDGRFILDKKIRAEISRRNSPNQTIRRHNRDEKQRILYRIRINGLPNNIIWQEVQEFIRRELEPVYIELQKGGLAYVDFYRESDADHAIHAFNNTKFNGNIVTIVKDGTNQESFNNRHSSSNNSSSHSNNNNNHHHNHNNNNNSSNHPHHYHHQSTHNDHYDERTHHYHHHNRDNYNPSYDHYDDYSYNNYDHYNNSNNYGSNDYNDYRHDNGNYYYNHNHNNNHNNGYENDIRRDHRDRSRDRERYRSRSRSRSRDNHRYNSYDRHNRSSSYERSRRSSYHDRNYRSHDSHDDFTNDHCYNSKK